MFNIWADAPEEFKNITSVAKYIANRFKTYEGKPISERTIRGHLQGRGKKGKLLFPKPKGGYDLKDVQDYVGRLGFIPIGQEPLKDEKQLSGQQLDLAIKQEEKKLEKLILQNANLEFELNQKKKEFCRISDLDAELAARGLAIKHFIEQYVSDKEQEIKNSDDVIGIIMEGVEEAISDYVSMISFYILQI